MKHTKHIVVVVINAAGIQLYCFVMENSIVQIIIVLLFPNYLLLLTAQTVWNIGTFLDTYLDSILSKNQHRNYLNSNGI